MANRHLEVPGQNQVMQAEATRSSHHILVIILTIGILLPDLRGSLPKYWKCKLLV